LYAVSFAVFYFDEGSERGEGREQIEGSKSLELERRKLRGGLEESVKRHPPPILNHRVGVDNA
jgi:hypothetical protein